MFANVFKAPPVGHEFYGNQYTKGKNVGDMDDKELRAESLANMRDSSPEALARGKELYAEEKKRTEARNKLNAEIGPVAAKLGKKLLGSGDAVSAHGNTVSWRKRGGHPNTKIQQIRDGLAKAGFKKVDVEHHAVPDGSYMGSGTHYKDKHGNTAYMSSTYGGVASDNSHYAEIKFNPEYLKKMKGVKKDSASTAFDLVA